MAGTSQADRAGHDEVTPASIRNAGEIERAIAAFARSGNGGLIVTPSQSASFHRNVIIALAARHKLPAICPYRYMVADGGLMSYAHAFPRRSVCRTLSLPQSGRRVLWADLNCPKSKLAGSGRVSISARYAGRNDMAGR